MFKYDKYDQATKEDHSNHNLLQLKGKVQQNRMFMTVVTLSELN